MTTKEKVIAFISVCGWDRDIGQYVTVKSSTSDTIIVDYCVPFQRRLSEEMDFRNICMEYFRDVKITETPAGFGSGSFDIEFNFKSVNIEKLEKFTAMLRKKSQDSLDEANRKLKEKQEWQETQIETEIAPLMKKREELTKKAEATQDKIEYYNYMMSINHTQKEIMKVHKRYRN